MAEKVEKNFYYNFCDSILCEIFYVTWKRKKVVEKCNFKDVPRKLLWFLDANSRNRIYFLSTNYGNTRTFRPRFLGCSKRETNSKSRFNQVGFQNDLTARMRILS